MGLKNDVEQIPQLVAAFDFTVNEECFAYDECRRVVPFVDADKAVFNIEYGGARRARKVCPQANALGFDSLVKNLDLDARRIACSDR